MVSVELKIKSKIVQCPVSDIGQLWSSQAGQEGGNKQLLNKGMLSLNMGSLAVIMTEDVETAILS